MLSSMVKIVYSGFQLEVRQNNDAGVSLSVSTLPLDGAR